MFMWFLQFFYYVHFSGDAQKTSVVLLGLSGCGKTSALDLILERAGGHYAVSEARPEAPQPTLACDRKKVFAEGRQLVLVDTPEMWDEDGLENLELVKDCWALALPGPHVFLLVLQVGRFTQGEVNMLGHLQKIFGRDFVDRTVVLFVRLDGDGRQRPQRISDLVAGAPTPLQALLQKCGSRYYELNVSRSQNALSYPQVKELLSGVTKLAASFGGQAYGTRRFSLQELQGRKRQLEGRREVALEGNHLLGK